ncbi:MAG: flagellar biosynthesis anti-sigma factor FlgM [Polaromonas sp.]|nr:flagellar biosynthesis anti-sigma factor FlgM [Polaromonas sp.]
MKIGNSPEKVAPTSTERVASGDANRTAAGAKAQGAQAVEASAQVELSSSASKLLDGVGAAGDGDFDAQKVERISQAISEGKFTVNAEAIADKLITNAQEVLGKVSSH